MTALAACLAIALAAVHDRGFFSYWLSHPNALDARSLQLLARQALMPAGAVALFCLSAGKLGGILARRVFGAALEAPAAFGLGLAVIGTAFFLQGAAGGFSPAGLLLAAGAIAACLIFPWRAPQPPSAPGKKENGPPLAWAALALCGFHILVLALAPPTNWDGLAHHLAIPKLYLRAGGLVELPWLLHSHWPHMMESLYALALGLGLEPAAALLHAACAGALVWAARLAAREQGGESFAWLAAAVLASQGALLGTAGAASGDAAFALMSFLCSWRLWRWSQAGAAADLALAGLLAGAAAACKLHGWVLLAFWAAWLAWRRNAKSAGIFFGAALPLAAPWLLRTWIQTGNPVWPFFTSAFGGKFGAALVEAPLWAQYRWPWPPPLELLLRYDPLPLLAASLAAWLLTRRDRLPPALRFYLLPAPFYALTVARQTEFWRFMIPFYPALALALAFRLRLLARRGPARAAAAAVLACLSMLALATASENNELFAALQLRSQSRPDDAPRDAYLERALDHYAAYRDFNAILARRPSRVLLFREIRGYYLDADYLWGDPKNQGLLDYASLRGVDALSARLDALGVTHVLVNEGLGMYRPETGYYSRAALSLMDAELARAKVAARRGGLALYERTRPNL